MDPFVFAAVLFAALCHASWNPLLKIRLDPFAANVLITVASGLIAAGALPFVGFATIVSWPWLVADRWHRSPGIRQRPRLCSASFRPRWLLHGGLCAMAARTIDSYRGADL